MQLPCPSCHSTLSLPDDAVGRKAQCPSCQSVFRVPESVASAVMSSSVVEAIVQPGRMDSVACPGCDKWLAFNDTSAGQIIICPTCRRRVQMPTAAAMRPSSVASISPVASAQPLLRTDQDAFSAPILTSEPSVYEYPTNYALPGWFLFGLSVLNLLYDVMWGGIMLIGAFADNMDADDVVPLVLMIAFAFVGMLIHLATLIGAFKMTQRRSLSTAKLGAVLAMIPCSVCSIVQWPFAIWALVLLFSDKATKDFVNE